MPTRISRILFVMTTILCLGLFTSSAIAQSAKIQLEIFKAGFIIGVSGGSGTLHLNGKSYPLSIGGVSLGATIGASKAELIGTVSNITKPEDIVGTYSAVNVGVALAGGKKVAQLKNSKGVILKVKGKQIGFEFALDLSGLDISLK